jgi:HEAT repeat protein
MLIEFVGSPHEPVQQAARDCLVEFRFPRYLETFDLLEADVRVSTGKLVKRIDEQAIPRLTEELQATSRSRRLRGVEMTLAMDAVVDVEPVLIRMLEDPDQFVRAAAVSALASHDSPETRRALRELLLDPNVIVRREAETALQAFATGAGLPQPGPGEPSSWGDLGSALGADS